MLTDIEISNNAKLLPIIDIAKKIGLSEDDIELYGKYKAKISFDAINRLNSNNKQGKLILMTAISPTPMGEGKTTQTIGLGQALNKLGKKVVIALREPSLGPCFGVKGGATGGGYSQVVPMEDINLHFTGDIHAITVSHNLIASLIDNHIYHSNKLKISKVIWKRVVDLNDRVLRNIIIGNSEKAGGKIREDSFMITVASEIMAILCLSENLSDLKTRLSKIIVAYDYDNKPITLSDLKGVGAVATLLKDAIKPNLVQTLEGVPVLIHGGPFANIAHGCNSIIATKTALKMADYVITEAGFGADLGAEKFFDIKCRQANLTPSVAVIVATCRSLKYNGGAKMDEIKNENLTALEIGVANLRQHIENLKKFNIPVVVCLNKFDFDTEKEITIVERVCKEQQVSFSISSAWANGGEGAIDVANTVLTAIENNRQKFNYLYSEDMPLMDKIKTIATEIYRAKKVSIGTKVKNKLEKYEEIAKQNSQKLLVCIAKTQYSFSDDPQLLSAPKDFTFKITDVSLSAGAGFVVCLAGEIMTMPGLPKTPTANSIDIDENGKVSGLF